MLNLTPGQVVDSWSHLNKVYSGTRRATPTEYGATENSTVPASPVMTPVSRISSTTEFGLETDGAITLYSRILLATLQSQTPLKTTIQTGEITPAVTHLSVSCSPSTRPRRGRQCAR